MTHAELSRDIHKERSQLIDLLMEARRLLVVSKCRLGYAIEDDRNGTMIGKKSAIEHNAEVERFLAKGLFGGQV
jgi:hypothetical protein